MSNWGDNIATEVFIPDSYGRFGSNGGNTKALSIDKAKRFHSKEYVKILERDNKEKDEIIRCLEGKIEDLRNLFLLPEDKPSELPDVDRVIKYICSFYKESKKQIMSKNREDKLPLYRQMIMFLLYKTLKHSTPTIARMFKMDTSTIRYSADILQDKMDADKDIKSEMYRHIQWVNENLK